MITLCADSKQLDGAGACRRTAPCYFITVSLSLYVHNVQMAYRVYYERFRENNTRLRDCVLMFSG